MSKIYKGLNWIKQYLFGIYIITEIKISGDPIMKFGGVWEYPCTLIKSEYYFLWIKYKTDEFQRSKNTT